MKLLELFDQTYLYSWSSKNSDRWEGHFVAKDGTIIDLQIEAFGDDYWYVSFERDRSTAETGQGDQIKIFSTIIKMLSTFIDEVSPYKIAFYAGKTKDDTNLSRVKLYRRMLNRFTPNYLVSELDREDKVKFVLLRK